MSPLDPLNEIGYMPPPSNLEDQIQLTPTIFGAPFLFIGEGIWKFTKF